MIEAVFGSPDPQSKRLPLRFDRPIGTYSANRLEEVIPLLKSVEAATRSGYWAALMLGYEAAPAFDRALKTHNSASFPLAWAAVFEKRPREQSEFEAGSYDVGPWQPQVSRAEFHAAIDRIRELIARGDTYQVNYTFPLVATFKGDPKTWYRDLCLSQGAEYCGYLDLGRYKLLSISPELFFERTGDAVKTKPMKGTIRRGRWADEDQCMARELAESAKDRAENVMIVDLLRNDLGRVSLPGTVRVSKLFEIERYETLWQMTSTVESTLTSQVGLAELLTALFPCGSITGAPKIRTMEIIRELEPFARGAYTGTIGFLRPGREYVFNVAIRTVVVDSETDLATFGVGGGITYDSTAEREYDECLLKSSFLDSRVEEFQLLESILLESGEFFLLSQHIERLKSTAEYFGFCWTPSVAKKVALELESIASQRPTGRWKVRLLLSRAGTIETEVLELNSETRAPLRVALAREPVDSTNRFLFHKTTNRGVYNKALSERPDCDDVILWNECEEITESSVANVVLPVGGGFFTPPQNSGLLAGTFRGQLLAEGKIRERAIHVSELKQATSFFLINSVHKWMKALLED